MSNMEILKRGEDDLPMNTREQYEKIFQVGQIITSEIDFDILFDVIINQTNKIMDVERCSIFLPNEKGEMLNAFVSAGVGGLAIQIPKSKGIVGWVFNNRKPAIVNNVYEDSRFYAEVDRRLGLQTNNILCVPLVKRNSECIGVLEIVNTKKGEFTSNDCDLLVHLSNYITIALENARLYKELKVMDRAKERVINHLSHELTTPISLLSGVIATLSKRLQKYEDAKASEILEMGKRNIRRLMDIQTKATDIVKYRGAGESEVLIQIISDAAGIIEDFMEQGHQANDEILKKIYDRIKSIYHVGETKFEDIVVDAFISNMVDEIVSESYRREVDIQQEVDANLTLYMDRNVLKRILFGLAKNAIENTPDEGKIEIKAYATDENVFIECVDHGVGITREHQAQIFGGFYHTQETHLYSTKKPFAFNAGGAGLDLLRAKILSERLGFHLDFVSKRCGFIPVDSDECPGRISLCNHIREESECRQSGGSTFCLKFPLPCIGRLK
jgi:K+-sensing histidine kinase KdpD